MMTDSTKYNQEFLDLHAEIKQLSRKFINKSNFLVAYASDEDKTRVRFVEILLENMVGGYVEPLFEDNEDEDSLDCFLKSPDRYRRRTILIEKIRQNRNYVAKFMLKMLSDRERDYRCVIYIDFSQEVLTSIAKLLSQPEIITGVHIDTVLRHVEKNKGQVAFCFGGRDNRREVLMQSSIEIKRQIYDIIVKHGDIYNDNYESISLTQRGLLWGVPPLPNVEQAKLIIENLKKS